jgi:hypothetical protein
VRRIAFVVLAILIPAVLGGAASFLWKPASPANIPMVDGATYTVDLGVHINSPEPNPFFTSFTIRNDSDKRLRVGEVKVSCNCTRVIIPKSVVEPHGLLEGQMNFTQPAGKGGGYFDGKAVIQTFDELNGREGFFAIEYTGFDLRTVTILPPRLNFGKHSDETTLKPLTFDVYLPLIDFSDGTLKVKDKISVVEIVAPSGIECTPTTVDPFITNSAPAPLSEPVIPNNLPENELLSGTQSQILALQSSAKDIQSSYWQHFVFTVRIQQLPRSLDTAINVKFSNSEVVRLPIIVEKGSILKAIPPGIVLAGGSSMEGTSITLETGNGAELLITKIHSEAEYLHCTSERLSKSAVKIILHPAPSTPTTGINTRVNVLTNIGEISIPIRQLPAEL